MNVSEKFTITAPRNAVYKALGDKRGLMKVYLRRAVRAALNTGTVVNARDH